MRKRNYEAVWPTSAIWSDTELWRWVSSLTKYPEKVLVTAKPYRPTRSTEQNYYYWGPFLGSIVAWAESMWYGWDENDAHAFVKVNFFIDIGHFEELVRFLKDGVLTPQDFLFETRELVAETTTTDSDTKEFSDKIDKVRTYFRDKHDWHIPLPNEAPLPTEPWTPRHTSR